MEQTWQYPRFGRLYSKLHNLCCLILRVPCWPKSFLVFRDNTRRFYRVRNGTDSNPQTSNQRPFYITVLRDYKQEKLAVAFTAYNIAFNYQCCCCFSCISEWITVEWKYVTMFSDKKQFKLHRSWENVLWATNGPIYDNYLIISRLT
jgi:hypothetical protein